MVIKNKSNHHLRENIISYNKKNNETIFHVSAFKRGWSKIIKKILILHKKWYFEERFKVKTDWRNSGHHQPSTLFYGIQARCMYIMNRRKDQWSIPGQYLFFFTHSQVCLLRINWFVSNLQITADSLYD